MTKSLQIFDYHIWANGSVFKHINGLPHEIYHQKVDSVFSSLSETVMHMYQVDYIWLMVIKQNRYEDIIQAINPLNELKSASLEIVEEKFRQIAKEYNQFISQLDDIHSEITIQHPSFGALTASYEELFHHVVNHGTYHRGNITAILRQLGYKGIPTDYIFYLYDHKGKQR